MAAPSLPAPHPARYLLLMKIQVLYFAIFRERLGLDEETIELPGGATVATALEHLGARHQVIAALAGRFQVAVNQTMSPGDTALADGDELALIPPVAGGADSERHVRVVEEPPSLDRCVAAVGAETMGGIVTFTGVVRRTNQGRDVERLEYEAYVEMAEKVMREIGAEIEAEIEGTRIAVEHRIGKLVVGDIAVVIAAAAPHRAEAFTACRAMIDRLKERVPIWKKEIGPDGAEWIGMGP
jgi:molybdopterin synthase catalytic subunit